MATVAHTVTPLAKGAALYTWADLANGDTGIDFSNLLLSEKTVQVTGTFGTGGTVALEGSNDGTNYETLKDPQGNSLSFTAAGLEAVQENPRFIRPNVSAGDGTTALTVTLAVKGDLV